MTVRFGSTDPDTSQQETMLREQFGNLSGFNQVSVSQLNSNGGPGQCNTKYEGYIVLFDSTGVFCKSPCNDTSYCNNHGNCTHLETGPNCSCDPACTDKQKCTGCTLVDPNLFKILFGTLGALLGVGILLGIVCYCVKRRSPSKSIVADDHIYYTC
uniref:mucin-4-like n=1 Tax=Myxine glutinosa TaxID=7769 RepID=UPI00358EA3C6